ncbi:unnamed protein product [Mytilus coruscus]|uniref:TLDc domain-containing protein n=1 Tax=Mytilus coruscus TaxID=42192 RepID=A0A6J8CFS8_MYTCO|nr:unnamed protein product [Mytilus coruscus]
MGVEFKKNDQLQMNKWIDGNKRYTLLYKGRGPTVTILYNINNSVFGGYTSVSWRSAGAYHTDAYAFLFRLNQNGKWNPVKMAFSCSYNYAIYDEASYSPTFGGGDDLKTFKQQWNRNLAIIANGHLQIKDIEVFLVEDLRASPSLEEPWRKTPQWDEKLLNYLKEKIEQYKPLQELKVPQARLLLVGQVGAGKSSFFNTINSIFREHLTSQACSGNAEHSLTTVYRMYQIRNGTSGKPLNFRLHDTRGIEADQGIDGHEMCFLLDGHIPDRHQVFNPSVPLSTDIPHISEKIHCVVFVIDGSTVDVIQEKVIERIKTLQSRMNQRGHYKFSLKNPVIQETVDRVAQIIGLPRSHILPIKNNESEMELNDNVNILILLALQHILHFSDDYMYNYLDEIEEVKMQKLSFKK